MGRAPGRGRAGDRRAPGRAGAVPRPGRVDPDRDRDRGDAARLRRRAARVLAAAVGAHRLPRRRRARARDALRGAGRGARLRRRVPARRGAHAAAARLPAAGQAAGLRRARGRPRRGRRRDPGARRRSGARQERPVVRLRELGARDGEREDGELLVGPRLQPAGLAARRARAAAGEGALPRVLEGGRPRPVRRPDLAPRPAPARRAREPAAAVHARGLRALVAADQGDAAQPGDRHVPRRGHHDGDRRRRRLPDRRRRLQLERRARPRRQLRGRRVLAAARRPPAAGREHRLLRLAAQLRLGAPAPAPPGRGQPPGAGAGRVPVLGHDGAARGRALRRAAGRRRSRDRALGARAHLGALQGAARRRGDAVRVRPARRGPPRPGLRLLRAAAGLRRHARGLPVRREDRLLPAVLRGGGAAAADGGDPRPRRDRLHDRLVRREAEGVRRARPRRALVGRGLVPRVRLGHARPDAGELPARSQPNEGDRGRHRPAGGRAGPRRRAAQRPRERPRARPGAGHELGRAGDRRAASR